MRRREVRGGGGGGECVCRVSRSKGCVTNSPLTSASCTEEEEEEEEAWRRRRRRPGRTRHHADEVRLSKKVLEGDLPKLPNRPSLSLSVSLSRSLTDYIAGF